MGWTPVKRCFVEQGACMRWLGFMAAMMMAAPAAATNISVFDSFDTENGGAPQADYYGFANWSVVALYIDDISIFSAPHADLVDGFDGLSCAGGSGLCVHLHAATEGLAAELISDPILFNAGDTISFSYEYRDTNNDYLNSITAGVWFDAPFLPVANFTFIDPVHTTIPTLLPGGAAVTGGSNIHPFGSPFQTDGFSFTALEGGRLRVNISVPWNGDGGGLLIDNVQYSILSGAVPEPATWAMMITGFGLVGGAMRRRPRKLLPLQTSPLVS